MEEAIPVKFAKTIASMLPRTLTSVGSRITTLDIPALLHFSHLARISAHRFAFAPSLLAHHRMFPELRSIATSNTSLADSDLSTLSGRSWIVSLHFAATQLTDDALACFGTLPDLELLDIRETRVTDEGLLHLTTLRNLFTIDARGTSVSADGARTYRERVAKWLPDVEVLLWTRQRRVTMAWTEVADLSFLKWIVNRRDSVTPNVILTLLPVLFGSSYALPRKGLLKRVTKSYNADSERIVC